MRNNAYSTSLFRHAPKPNEVVPMYMYKYKSIDVDFRFIDIRRDEMVYMRCRSKTTFSRACFLFESYKKAPTKLPPLREMRLYGPNYIYDYAPVQLKCINVGSMAISSPHYTRMQCTRLFKAD